MGDKFTRVQCLLGRAGAGVGGHLCSVSGLGWLVGGVGWREVGGGRGGGGVGGGRVVCWI